jgi:hypothetical protein
MTDLKGVEIFAAGTWNGDLYSEKDLDSIVSAYDLMPRRPPLKLGHSETQKFFGQTDGAPALGWVEKVYRNGKKLLADFTKVPDVVANFIRGGNYDRVSAEIYWNFKLPEGDKVLPRALKAVSLLGADMPAITSLQDLQTVLLAEGEAARVYDGEAGDAIIKNYEIIESDQGGQTMDEKVYKEQIATLTDAQKAEAARADKAEADLRAEREGNAVREFTLKIGELKRAGKILPAEEPGLVRSFRGMEGGVRKFSDGEYDPRIEFVKSLEARTKVVEFKEQAQGGEGEGEGEGKDDKLTVASLLRKYTRDGLTEGQAFVKIKDEHPEEWNQYIKPGKGGK